MIAITLVATFGTQGPYAWALRSATLGSKCQCMKPL